MKKAPESGDFLRRSDEKANALDIRKRIPSSLVRVLAIAFYRLIRVS